MPNDFRVYRLATGDAPEERQDMIVPDPNRGFVCATEVNEKRAFQWAHTFSSTDRRATFEVRELRIKAEEAEVREVAIARFKGGRKFL